MKISYSEIHCKSLWIVKSVEVKQFYKCRAIVTCTRRENGVKNGFIDINPVLVEVSNTCLRIRRGNRASGKFRFSRIQNLLRFYQKLEFYIELVTNIILNKQIDFQESLKNYFVGLFLLFENRKLNEHWTWQFFGIALECASETLEV